MSDPRNEVPDDLRRLVQGLRSDVLEKERVERIERRLGPILGPGGGGASGAAGGSTGTTLGLAGKLVSLALLAGVIAGAVLLTRRPPPPSVQSASSAELRPDISTAPLLGAERSSQAPLPAATVTVTPALKSAPGASASARIPSAAPAEDIVAEEDILLRARAALASSPATALDLAQEHAKKYPRGALAQEREVLAIDALGRLGRTEEASSRAQRFKSNWPTSPYVRQLRDRGLIE